MNSYKLNISDKMDRTLTLFFIETQWFGISYSLLTRFDNQRI